MASLLRSSAGMAAGTVLSRITGVLRDMMMTAALGFFIVSDAYSLGNTLPNIIYILVAGGALNAVFIPQLIRHMESDLDGGKAYADRLLSAVGLILLVLSALSVALAPYIVDIYTTSNISQNQYDLAVAFARLCLPQMFFYGAYTMLQQVLNARGKFVGAMFAPVANNLVAIFVFASFIWVVRPTSNSLTTLTPVEVWWLGLGTTVGVALQALVLFPPLLKSGYKYQFRSDWRDSDLGKAGSLAAWTLGLVMVNQIAYAVITRLATAANIEAEKLGATAAGLTTYQKAHLIFVLPHSVIAVSVVTALLPRLSQLAHVFQFEELGTQVGLSSRQLMAMLFPIAGLLTLTAPDLVQLLFGYGAAGADSARLTGQVVSIFCIGLPAYSLVYVLYRAWYAMEDTKTPFKIAVLINLLNLGFGFWLFQSADKIEDKIPALAWSYSIAYSIAAVVAAIWLNRRVPGLKLRQSIVRVFLIAVATAVTVAIVSRLPEFGTETALALFETVVLKWVVGIVIFIATATLLRISEVKDALKLVTSRLPGRAS